VANPNGYYVEDWCSSYHEKGITTLRSEEVAENQEEEGKEEQIEVTRDLHQEKGKEVSIELLQHQFLFLNYQEAMRVVY